MIYLLGASIALVSFATGMLVVVWIVERNSRHFRQPYAVWVRGKEFPHE